MATVSIYDEANREACLSCPLSACNDRDPRCPIYKPREPRKSASHRWEASKARKLAAETRRKAKRKTARQKKKAAANAKWYAENRERKREYDRKRYRDKCEKERAEGKRNYFKRHSSGYGKRDGPKNLGDER